MGIRDAYEYDNNVPLRRAIITGIRSNKSKQLLTPLAELNNLYFDPDDTRYVVQTHTYDLATDSWKVRTVDFHPSTRSLLPRNVRESSYPANFKEQVRKSGQSIEYHLKNYRTLLMKTLKPQN